MSNAADRLTEWILERVESDPLRIRIQILRDTAATVGGAKIAPKLTKMAEDLEEIERRHRQLLIDLGDTQR